MAEPQGIAARDGSDREPVDGSSPLTAGRAGKRTTCAMAARIATHPRSLTQLAELLDEEGLTEGAAPAKGRLL